VRYGYRAKLEQGDGVTEMYEKTRAEGFGDEVKRRVMIGTYVLSAGFYDAYYNRARKVRALIKRDFETVFADGVDAILTPATPSAAFELGQEHVDPVEMYLNDVFTVTVNLAGLPAWPCPRVSTARPAARPATDRTALGRGRIAEHRLCAGASRGFCGETCEMVVKGPKIEYGAER
jgi:Asp-tRNA(Asn)/Glu-tRNA(Gln) amidotransferase A subunit family amidase